MPRGRCHFALSYCLHERLRGERPDVARLIDRHLSDFLAGTIAPDGLRIVGRMGKRATHFYEEDLEETWGRAVEGMFRAHPELARADRLSERDRVLIIGYVSHLSVDEAFRNEVTCHVHGVDDWRPVIQGLWSMVDELPTGYPGILGAMDGFSRRDRVGFIDCAKVGQFLAMVRPWAAEQDPWEIEKAFLEVIGSDVPLEEAHRAWEARRKRAAPFLEAPRLKRFVAEAVHLGVVETSRFLDGGYCGNAGGDPR